MKKTNIVLTGVGGQGVITAANILGKAAINAKLNVFVSEVHGMAQRGGSVIEGPVFTYWDVLHMRELI